MTTLTFKYLVKNFMATLSGPVDIHIEFVSKTSVQNIVGLIEHMTDVCHDYELARVFDLPKKSFKYQLYNYPEIYETCYLPNKDTMTVIQRRDALSRMFLIGRLVHFPDFIAEVQQFINQYSANYKMTDLTQFGKCFVVNDYTRMLDALSLYFTTGQRTEGLSLQINYEEAIAEYLSLTKKNDI